MHSYTLDFIRVSFNEVVLILVVMEDALVPGGNCWVYNNAVVLILVVMEDALVHITLH